MIEKQIAIKIDNLYKKYRLGMIGGGTLYRDLQSWWAKFRKKEDPNSKIYAKKHTNDTFFALDGIELTIYKGERIGIIGSNGAGKSTMLKILSQVTAPTEGEIYINGRISSMLEVGTGFNPELTGKENIYLNGAILGMTKAEVDNKLEQIIEFSECAQFIDTPVKRYSSGMYVKLAFAVAAHLDSEILVMDEVLAVGDMKFQQKCLGKMGDVSEQDGKTILYVSHNMSTIRQLCDRVIVLCKGKVIFDGGAEEGINEYMNATQVNREGLVSLENIKRIGNFNWKVKLIEMEILNSQINNFKYSNTNAIELKFRMYAQENYNDLSFRITIKRTDKVIIGTAISPSSIAVKKGADNTAIIGLTLPMLDDGSYLGEIYIYRINEWGSREAFDGVHDMFSFDILNETYPGQMIWDQQWMGNIHFPDIKIYRGMVE